jgi:hypothetical protein
MQRADRQLKEDEVVEEFKGKIKLAFERKQSGLSKKAALKSPKGSVST